MAHKVNSLIMQGLIGIMRIYLKHAAILLATGLLFQLAALHSGAQDKPKRPRITGIDHVRLYVTDIGKANDFYSKIVGLPTKTAYGCEYAPANRTAVSPLAQAQKL